MQINKLHLSGFRNFKDKLIDFRGISSVIVGDNASGKTNILEAIYLLSTGKSFRAHIEKEMINHKKQIARVKAQAVESNNQSEGAPTKLEAVLTRGVITLGYDPDAQKSIVPRKKIMVNGVARRLFNFAGILKVVLFGPWDLDLITESPSVRRRFMDMVLSGTDREYARALLSYEKGLRQRNRLLIRIREEGLSRSQLLFWDNLLIKNGDYLSHKRRELIEFINKKPSVNSESFRVTYDNSPISQKRLDDYKEEEVLAGTTLVGPHRDDFLVYIKKVKRGRFRDLAKYGSRGEQRMGVLWLKIAELSYVEAECGEKPVLLLDDIFSELDHEHRKLVMDLVENKYSRDAGGQVIITTADPHFVEGIRELSEIKL